MVIWRKVGLTIGAFVLVWALVGGAVVTILSLIYGVL